MIKIQDKKNCSGCSACESICPVNAIRMVNDCEGFLYPRVDISKCINCNLCSKRCPKINYKCKKVVLNKAYAAYCKEESVRQASSSGGLFTVLAEVILESGGVVFGAAFDENNNVKHKMVDNLQNLREIVGSKYVQSDTREVYVLARQYLKQGKKVLFSGTACQIEGLLSYLTQDLHKNLYCIDLICLGVPSPYVWQKYKQLFIPRANITNINFKDKMFGWNKFHMHFGFADGKDLYIRGIYNEYMQTYFRKYNLRPSCYSCQFKSKHRKSDITLADCWGITDFAQDMNDNKGCSSVIVHSQKGIELFESVKNRLFYREILTEKIIQGNPNYLTCANEPKLRFLFWKGMGMYPKITFYFFGNSFYLKIKNAVKRVIGR